MGHSSYDNGGDIQVLGGLEPIRRRPQMYVGPLSDPATLSCVVLATLCIGADELAAGAATRMTVTLLEDGTIVVEDDGIGLPVDVIPRSDGLRIPDLIASALRACQLVKDDHGIGERFCNAGIVVTNALSELFEFSIARDGEEWHLRFERGVSVAQLHRVGATSRHGTIVRFRPDPQLFGTLRVDASLLAARIAESAGELAPKIVLSDLRLDG